VLTSYTNIQGDQIVPQASRSARVDLEDTRRLEGDDVPILYDHSGRGRRPDAGRPRRAHRAGRVRRMKASPYTIDNDFATTHSKQRGPILHHDASAAKHACMHVYVCLHMRTHMMKLICRAACIHVYLYICNVYVCA